MKARVRIIDAVDKIWFTCCALHNMLLDIDGMSEDWLGKVGFHEFDQVNPNSVPTAILRLSNNLTTRDFDLSGMGRVVDCLDNDVIDVEYAAIEHEKETKELSRHVIRHVCNLHLSYFRCKLVEHFEILWEQKKYGQ